MPFGNHCGCLNELRLPDCRMSGRAPPGPMWEKTRVGVGSRALELLSLGASALLSQGSEVRSRKSKRNGVRGEWRRWECCHCLLALQTASRTSRVARGGDSPVRNVRFWLKQKSAFNRHQPFSKPAASLPQGRRGRGRGAPCVRARGAAALWPQSRIERAPYAQLIRT